MPIPWFRPQGGKELDFQRSSIDGVSRPSTTANDLDLTLKPTHATPHDAVIALLQAPPALEPTTPKNEAGKAEYGAEDDRKSPVTPISPAVSRLDLGLSPAPSMYTSATTTKMKYGGNQPSASQHPSADLLLDPFDGTSHGILFPQDNNIGTQEDIQSAPRFNSASVAAASEGMWTHLSKVLDLQSQIAKMHIDMEGIGTGDSRKKPKAKHAAGRGANLREERRVYQAVASLRARGMSNASTIVDEKENDEEGMGVTDEETEKNRAREEEFAKLANQFEGKKESIKEIMNKLDDLSKALTEFHALQAPEASTPKHNFIPAAPLPPEPNRATPSASLPPPRIQVPDNMLWAPPKPLVLPQSLSRLNRTAAAPTLFSDFQPHVMESPVSTLGSLQLPPED